MNEVKCVNAKKYKLTVGKTYNINSTIDDEYYEILNDNNKLVKYKKDLFNVSKSTIADIITSIQINHGIVSLTIDGIDIKIDDCLANDGTQISCGIQQVYGINNFVESIVEALSPYDRETLINDVLSAIFKTSIIEFGIEDNAAMLLISTNLDNANEDGNEHFDRIDNLLTPFTKASHIAHNPNSDNTIKLWVIDVDTLLN